MKVRVRSLESRETLKIQVPDSCSLQQFNYLLSLAISSSPSPSPSPSSIYLSLNRKDELQASSSLDSLQSLGVTSGDLIFYTFNTAAFSRQAPSPSISETLDNQGTPILSQTPAPTNEETLIQSETPPLTKPVMEEAPILSETLVSNTGRIETATDSQALAPFPSVPENPPDAGKNEAQECLFATGMDIDGEGGADDGAVVVKKSVSEACFLRKVLREEVGDDGNEYKVLVIAVHAVLLESGFVGFDTVSGTRVDRFHLPEECPFSMSLWYTLPELLDHGCDDSPAIQSVVLKFQRLGRFINIYGSLSSKRSTVCRASLDEYRFAPTLDLMWTHSDSAEERDTGSNNNSYPENEVFEFWKIVKDGLASPLLIDLCENAGLLPPPCLMRLPIELKLKILELLPAVALANVGCVCSELRYLSSNNDLWKQRFVEEFGNVHMGQGSSLWKDRFVSWWESKKKRKRAGSIWKLFPSIDGPSYFPAIIGEPNPNPNPYGRPGWIGGEYDRIPTLRVHPAVGVHPAVEVHRIPRQQTQVYRGGAYQQLQHQQTQEYRGGAYQQTQEFRHGGYTQTLEFRPGDYDRPLQQDLVFRPHRNTIPRCNLGARFMG